MIERDHRVAAALAIALYSRTANSNNVELAVVIAIDQASASAHRFENVLLVRRRNVRNGESSLLRDVFKLWHRSLRNLALRKLGWRPRGCRSFGLARFRLRTGGLARRRRDQQKQHAQAKPGSHRRENFLIISEPVRDGSAAISLRRSHRRAA